MAAAEVAVTATPMPFGVNKGKPTSTILTVLYEDGTVAFRCADCPKEFPKPESAWAHRKAHAEPRTAPAPDRKVRKAISLLQQAADEVTTTASVTPLSNRRLLKEIERLQARLDAERKRRRAAERDLNRIRQAVGQMVDKPGQKAESA